MPAEERRLWRQFVLDVLRPEQKPTRPSRRVLIIDVLLAIVLTVVAVDAAQRFQDGDAFIGVPQLVPTRSLPEPPEVPQVDPTWPFDLAQPVRPLPPDDRRSSEPSLFLVALTALPLAARRRYPLSTFWVVVLAALTTTENTTWITVLNCAIAAYGVVAHSHHRVPAVAGLVLAAVLAGATFRDSLELPSSLGPFVVLLSAGVLASVVRFWQQRLRAGRDRLTELRQAQEQAMREAVEEERARIAAELHDVVTHNVSVMVIQAGAARKVMDAQPEESKRALLAIEAGGRAAMAELRHVMGLLAGSDSGRPDSPADGLEPQPGLDQLDALVDRVRAAGIPVSVSVSPPPGPLPPGVALAAYRVVQEALTNTIKHAANASASVAIDYHGDWMEIEVTDTGGRPRNSSGTSGRGLIGLRERLAVYGGTLDAGRRTGGGYRIKARVPWRAR